MEKVLSRLSNESPDTMLFVDGLDFRWSFHGARAKRDGRRYHFRRKICTQAKYLKCIFRRDAVDRREPADTRIWVGSEINHFYLYHVGVFHLLPWSRFFAMQSGDPNSSQGGVVSIRNLKWELWIRDILKQYIAELDLFAQFRRSSNSTNC